MSIKGHYHNSYPINAENHVEGVLLKAWAEKKSPGCKLTKDEVSEFVCNLFSTKNKV